MAMLSGVDDLTLARLNEITQAWVEGENVVHNISRLMCSRNLCCHAS